MAIDEAASSFSTFLIFFNLPVLLFDFLYLGKKMAEVGSMQTFC
jgi:uncharacterized membrane-anchored protein YitT (DUF2179 family)